MLITVTIPCHGRTEDLEKSLPTVFKSAKLSPPCEILVLNYNRSPDYLDYFMADFASQRDKRGKVYISYYKWSGGTGYFHMAHSRNLCVKLASGEFVINSGTSVTFSPEYIRLNREAMNAGYKVVHNRWMNFIGVIGFRVEEFYAAGGYDERFEYYGKEDKDLYRRFERRLDETEMFLMPLHVLDIVNPQRYQYYPPTDRQPFNLAKDACNIFNENEKNRIVVANQGKDWGSLNGPSN
jgi:hypothetical protein